MVSASCAMYTFSLKTCTSKERREKSFLQDHWSNDKGLPLAQNIDCLQNENWKSAMNDCNRKEAYYGLWLDTMNGT